MAMNDRHGDAFDAFLARKGSLNRLYREIPVEEPPQAVDDAILAASRRAVRAGPRKGVSPFGLGWRLPFAVAASLLVSATLVLMMQDEREEQPLPSAAPAARMVVPAEPAVEPHAERQPDAARAVPAPKPREREAARAPVLSPEVAHAPIPSTEVAPAPVFREEQNKAFVPAPKAEVRPSVSAPAPAEAAPSMPQLSDDVDKLRARSAPAAAAKRSIGPGEGAAPAARQKAERTGAELAPESWIAQIRALRDQGEEAEAYARLRMFRERYPDYRLPDDLRNWSPVP